MKMWKLTWEDKDNEYINEIKFIVDVMKIKIIDIYKSNR